MLRTISIDALSGFVSMSVLMGLIIWGFGNNPVRELLENVPLKLMLIVGAFLGWYFELGQKLGFT